MIGTPLKISTASSGDNTLVAGVTGYRVRLLGYALTAAGAVAVKWIGLATDLSGAMTLATGTPLVVPQMVSEGVRQPWLQTGSGEALILNLSGAVQVSGHLVYDLEAV